MDSIKLPAAIYGRGSDTNADSSTYGFGWREKSGDFPDKVKEILWEWLKHIQWAPGEGKHAPAYAWLPVREKDLTGGVLMRLLDTGPDDHNRPHTLRTEFLWCDSEKLERIPLVLYGLQKDAWPETSLLTVTDATLKITSMPARLLAAALNQNSMVNKRVMVANYKTLTDKVWDGIDIALDNEYQPIKHPFAQTTRRSEAVTSTPAATTQRRKKSGVLRKIGRGVVFVLLLAMAGYIAFTHDWTGGDTSIKNVPEASLDEKTESLKNANRSLETKLGALENEIQSLRTENRDLQARSTESINREELQSKIESLTESINDLSPNQIIKELDGILKSIVKETPDSPIQKQQIYNLDK